MKLSCNALLLLHLCLGMQLQDGILFKEEKVSVMPVLKSTLERKEVESLKLDQNFFAEVQDNIQMDFWKSRVPGESFEVKQRFFKCAHKHCYYDDQKNAFSDRNLRNVHQPSCPHRSDVKRCKDVFNTQNRWRKAYSSSLCWFRRTCTFNWI